MYESTTQLRVRYAETDQMNVVYYGNYAQYFEVGRVEAIRQLGYTYKDMEASGVIMPVVEMHVRYLRPATYERPAQPIPQPVPDPAKPNLVYPPAAYERIVALPDEAFWHSVEHRPPVDVEAVNG